MHTTHRGNRKPKGNSSSTRIEGVSTSEWDEFLQKNYGAPATKRQGVVTTEIENFITHAHKQGYSFPQIRSAVELKFKLKIAASTCSRHCNAGERAQ